MAKVEEQNKGIEALLKQLLDESVAHRAALVKVEDTVKEGALRIDELERKAAAPPSPPPPPPPKFPPPQDGPSSSKQRSTVEQRVDPAFRASDLHVDTWNRGKVEGILGTPLHPPEMGTSHSTPATPNFRSGTAFGKHLEFRALHTYPNPPNPANPDTGQTNHVFKNLPKLDFPKFNGDNPKIWKRKCEVYFEVYSVPVTLRTRFATLNFVDKAALWLETIELNGRIEEWEELCSLVMYRWGRDQHQTFMRQILALRQTGTVVEYIEKFEELCHLMLLHDPAASQVFFVPRFHEGLHDDIRSAITFHRPADMDTVCSLAILQEEEHDLGK